MCMELIEQQQVQNLLNQYQNKPVYLHVETTNGAYASHFDEKVFNAGTFLRNIQVSYIQGIITGGNKEPYRVGLKLDNGWIYVQGLTHFEIDAQGRFLMAGLNYQGQLAAALQISETPFEV